MTTKQTTVEVVEGSIRYAFGLGWAHGAEGTALRTHREVETTYPLWGYAEATAYLNGADDGERGDRFRLDMRA